MKLCYYLYTQGLFKSIVIMGCPAESRGLKLDGKGQPGMKKFLPGRKIAVDVKFNKTAVMVNWFIYNNVL